MNPQEQFCPNLACPARGRADEGNIVIDSQKEERYKYKVCRKTFVERSGTAYYRLHHDETLMTVVIALVANGSVASDRGGLWAGRKDGSDLARTCWAP